AKAGATARPGASSPEEVLPLSLSYHSWPVLSSSRSLFQSANGYRKPLPPTPSPKRRGGAELVFLPLSASARGLGGGVYRHPRPLAGRCRAAPARLRQSLLAGRPQRAGGSFAPMRRLRDEGNPARRWKRLSPLSPDTLGQQAAAAGLRQAGHLLSA